MGLASLTTVFAGLSMLGFYLVWALMGLNGSLEALFATIASGVFLDGQELKKSWTGVWAIDFVICLLVVFFEGLIDLSDESAYLMLLDLCFTICVINMMTLVESRRKEGSRGMGLCGVWQYLWDCGGVAVFFPIYSLLYVRRGSSSASPVPVAEAQALPFTAIWGLFLIIPLMRPAAIHATTQQGTVIFFLGPLFYVAFHQIVKSIFARTNYRGSMRPAKVAYFIVGAASAIVHVGVAIYAMSSLSDSNVSLSQIYIPNDSAVQRGQLNVVTKGALQFIQWDNVMLNTVALLLGSYVLCFEPVLRAKSSRRNERASTLLSSLVGITFIFGAGAGLAFAFYCKEHWLSSRLY